MIWSFAQQVEEEIAGELQRIDRLVDRNQLKTLDAFRAERVSDAHLFGSTGYGYGDAGRERLDRLFARIFGAEAALVRPQIVSGTHALAAAFFGLLRPGDTLLYATGEPYDTLRAVIGSAGAGTGSLREFGVGFDSVELRPEGRVDLEALISRMDRRTKVVAVQRSPGYAWRRALGVEEIAEVARAVKERNPSAWVVVDNCYGEFTEDAEPTEVGADLVAGSLIKNPGGGLAPTGGYIAGRRDAVNLAAHRLTAPGLGAETGSHEIYRLYYQGVFLAPHVTGEALKGNVFAAAALGRAGFQCAPEWHEPRRDIVLRVRLGSSARLLQFCRAIQANSPVDAHVVPEPWNMPGYESPVVMAAGGFVQGASIELSADAPMREPYIAYLQGGLTYSHVKIAVLRALEEMTPKFDQMTLT